MTEPGTPLTDPDHELEIALYDHQQLAVWTFRPVVFDTRPDTREICQALHELADRLEFENVLNEAGEDDDE